MRYRPIFSEMLYRSLALFSCSEYDMGDQVHSIDATLILAHTTFDDGTVIVQGQMDA
jgi:hypothetical protein